MTNTVFLSIGSTQQKDMPGVSFRFCHHAMEGGWGGHQLSLHAWKGSMECIPTVMIKPRTVDVLKENGTVQEIEQATFSDPLQ